MLYCMILCRIPTQNNFVLTLWNKIQHNSGIFESNDIYAPVTADQTDENQTMTEKITTPLPTPVPKPTEQTSNKNASQRTFMIFITICIFITMGIIIISLTFCRRQPDDQDQEYTQTVLGTDAFEFAPMDTL